MYHPIVVSVPVLASLLLVGLVFLPRFVLGPFYIYGRNVDRVGSRRAPRVQKAAAAVVLLVFVGRSGRGADVLLGFRTGGTGVRVVSFVG